MTIGPAKGLTDEQHNRFLKLSKRIYRRLGLTGYARLDFRLSHDGTPYFLEANPNPEIAADEEFAKAAAASGIGYPTMLERFVRLGLQRATRPAGS